MDGRWHRRIRKLFRGTAERTLGLVLRTPVLQARLEALREPINPSDFLTGRWDGVGPQQRFLEACDAREEQIDAVKDALVFCRKAYISLPPDDRRTYDLITNRQYDGIKIEEGKSLLYRLIVYAQAYSGLCLDAKPRQGRGLDGKWGKFPF